MRHHKPNRVDSRGSVMNLVPRHLRVAMGCLLSAASLAGQERTGDGTDAPSIPTIVVEFGPVEGFTTRAHPIPDGEVLPVPLGRVLRLSAAPKTPFDGPLTYVWQGAHELTDSGGRTELWDIDAERRRHVQLRARRQRKLP